VGGVDVMLAEWTDSVYFSSGALVVVHLVWPGDGINYLDHFSHMGLV